VMTRALIGPPWLRLAGYPCLAIRPFAAVWAITSDGVVSVTA
jgi:hypothetical protein